MGEFFDKDIRECDRQLVYNVIASCPQHRFLILTKQPQNAIDMPLLPNISLGISLNVHADLWRLLKLGNLGNIEPIGKRPSLFLSLEPLFADLSKDISFEEMAMFDLVIVGGQTRPLFLPKRQWVENIRGKILEMPPRIKPFYFEKNNLKRLITDRPLIQEVPQWVP